MNAETILWILAIVLLLTILAFLVVCHQRDEARAKLSYYKEECDIAHEKLEAFRGDHAKLAVKCDSAYATINNLRKELKRKRKVNRT